jgi:hypothetical protein
MLSKEAFRCEGCKFYKAYSQHDGSCEHERCKEYAGGIFEPEKDFYCPYFLKKECVGKMKETNELVEDDSKPT